MESRGREVLAAARDVNGRYKVTVYIMSWKITNASIKLQ